MKLGVVISGMIVAAALIVGCGSGTAGSARAPKTASEAAGTTTITSSTTPRRILPTINFDDVEEPTNADDILGIQEIGIQEIDDTPLQTWGVPPEPYTGLVGKYGF